MDQVHHEHRKRMKERFSRFGLDSFQDHEVLELLLFYALPYKNTNGMAHQMLNKFGSLSRVFSANREELKSISGIGDHAALLIELIPQLFRRYSIDLCADHIRYDTDEVIEEFVINHFIGKTKEHVQLFLFDASMRLITGITLCEGTFTRVAVNSEMIAEHIFANNAMYYILAHNHPTGDTTPSYNDIMTTREINRSLKALNRYMIDHYVVSDGKCRSVLTSVKEMFDKCE